MNLRWRYICAIVTMVFILVINIYILKSIFSNVDTSLIDFHAFYSPKATRNVKEVDVLTTERPVISFKTFGHLTIGFKYDLWFDICLSKGIHESLWHPLFPFFPQDQHILHDLDTTETSKEHKQSLKRLCGFVQIEHSLNYTFSLQIDGAVEVIFLFAGIAVPLKWDNSFEEIFYFTHNKNKNKKSLLVNTNHKMFLEQGYYAIEILSLGNVKALMKNEHENSLSVLNSTLIFHIESTDIFSYFTAKHFYKDRFPVNTISEKAKYSFHNLHSLQTLIPKLNETFLICPEIDITAPKVKLFKGIYMIDNVLVYPQEFLDFRDTMPVQRLLLPEERAREIAVKTVKVLSKIYQRDLTLKTIIHIHTNINEKFKPHTNTHRTYFLVELHVKDTKSNTDYQVSRFVQDLPTGFCLKKSLEANLKSKIYLLTPVKNQFVWVKYLLRVLAEVFKSTKETNVTLVLLDNESTDGDYKQLLQSTKDVASKYVKIKNHKFSKVKMLNEGLKLVADEDIAMVLDLHLQIPLDFFDRTRKLTIVGKTAFSPTLMRFQDPCYHERFTDLALKKVMWQDDGPGIIAMYKSDWSKVGGFNEKMFADKWGGEDWELVDRIIATGIHIIHYRIPRFYHLYHSRKKMWNH